MKVILKIFKLNIFLGKKFNFDFFIADPNNFGKKDIPQPVIILKYKLFSIFFKNFLGYLKENPKNPIVYGKFLWRIIY
jgi:hypothetical protein